MEHFTTSDGAVVPAAQGQLVVRLTEGISASDLANIKSLVATAGGWFVGQVPALWTVQVQFPSTQQALDSLTPLQAQPGVESVDPNGIVTSLDDPCPGTSQSTGSYWIAQVGASFAWQITSGDAGVTIGVVDRGLGAAAPLAATRVGVINIRGETIARQDALNSHGSKVASLAAGAAAEGACVGGIAPSCRVLAVDLDAASPDGTYSETELQAGICAAVDGGARVINVSQGPAGLVDDADPNVAKIMQQFRKAMSGAMRYAAAHDCLVVWAAGNIDPLVFGLDNQYLPAWYRVLNPGIEALWHDNSVIVAAVDDRGELLSTSVLGSVVDLSAPGQCLWTALSDGSCAGDSGTSFATPLVTGTAGLIRSINPNLSAKEVKGILVRSAAAQHWSASGLGGSGVVHAGTACSAARFRWEVVPATTVFPIGGVGVGYPGAVPGRIPYSGSITNVTGRDVENVGFQSEILAGASGWATGGACVWNWPAGWPVCTMRANGTYVFDWNNGQGSNCPPAGASPGAATLRVYLRIYDPNLAPLDVNVDWRDFPITIVSP
jgi:subtilisin family serine protease